MLRGEGGCRGEERCRGRGEEKCREEKRKMRETETEMQTVQDDIRADSAHAVRRIKSSR